MKLLWVCLAIVILSGCIPMSDERATRAVQAAGMTDVQITGVPIWGCGEEDTVRAKFEAKDRSGNRVTGVVCGGIFKGATVRVD